jgi:hypothetical protein
MRVRNGESTVSLSAVMAQAPVADTRIAVTVCFGYGVRRRGMEGRLPALLVAPGIVARGAERQGHA